MADDVRQKLTWLDQVATDRAVSAAAFKVGYVLSGYINRQSGTAWPTQETLANAVGLSSRAVRTLLGSLVERGHLECQAGRGRHKPNIYRLVVKDRSRERDEQERKAEAHFPFSGAKPEAEFRYSNDKTGNSAHENRKFDVQKPERSFLQNPLKEPIEEPGEESDSENDLLGLSKLPRKRSRPSDATPDGFEEFWSQVPKKAAKAAAQRAYERVMTKRLATSDELLAGILRYAAERDGQDVRYTKHPATWLNGGCWADEPARSGQGRGFARPSRGANGQRSATELILMRERLRREHVDNEEV